MSNKITKACMYHKNSSLETFLLSKQGVVQELSICKTSTIFFSLAQQPNEDQGRLIYEGYRSHTMTHHSQQDSAGRGIGPSQRLRGNVHKRQTSMPPASKLAATEHRLKPLGSWDRHNLHSRHVKSLRSYFNKKNKKTPPTSNHCATSRKVACLIADGVTGIFQ